MAEPARQNPLGCPVDRAGHDTLTGQLQHGHPAQVPFPRLAGELARRRGTDHAILARSRRWTTGPEPGRLGPADVPAVRYLSGTLHWRQIAGMTSPTAQQLHARQLARVAAELDALTSAVPYFLPAASPASETTDVQTAGRGLAEELARLPNGPADGRIRLPFPRVLVVLAEGVLVPGGGRSAPGHGRERGWPDELRQRLGDHARTLDRAVPDASSGRAWRLLSAAATARSRKLPGFWLPLHWLIEHGGAVTGVVLHGNVNSGSEANGWPLTDRVVWLVTVPLPPGPAPSTAPASAEPPVRTLIPGRLSQATLAPLATTAAVSIHQCAWTLHELLPVVPERHRSAPDQPRPEHDPVVLPGVRVLDLTTPRRAPSPEPMSRPHGPGRPRARPASHERSPHVRRVRVGPRDNWRYEEREIPGRWVDTGIPPKQTTVRKLPAPVPTPDEPTQREER